jgi:hypothetical protein
VPDHIDRDEHASAPTSRARKPGDASSRLC